MCFQPVIDDIDGCLASKVPQWPKLWIITITKIEKVKGWKGNKDFSIRSGMALTG
jgi:hypothetical protein